jgi:cytochrome c553
MSDRRQAFGLTSGWGSAKGQNIRATPTPSSSQQGGGESGWSRRGREFRRALMLAIAAALCMALHAGTAAADTLEERLQQCAACHGESGNSKMENIPSLAGQPELFLTNQLILMRERVRRSEIMEPFVKGLKDDEIVALAAHYAKLKSEPSGEGVDHALVARGTDLAVALRCGSCHQPTLAGQEQIPRLAHQRIDYLIKSLVEYRNGSRSGIDTSMNGVMYRMSDSDIRALAHYVASLR